MASPTMSNAQLATTTNLTKVTPQEYIYNLKQQFGGTLEVLQNLYMSNEELNRSLEDYKLDLRNITEQSRALQRKYGALEEQLNIVQKNTYTLVLVDADGMIFNTSLIADGRAGGKIAAKRLHRAVKAHISGATPHIRVYANIEGLARALKSANLIGSVGTLRDFVVGFSDPCVEHCDFVDVGDGKEMADEKIKSELKWHLNNPNCSRILLGASHDNGYARVLSTLNHARIELLEGPPFARELEALEIPHVRFPELFATSKIEAFTSAPSPVSSPAQPPPPALNSVPPGLPPPGLSSPSPQKTFSYAAAANSASTPPPSPKTASAQLAQSNAAPSREAMLRVKSLTPKPCNNYYLKGDCMFEKCYFGHGYKLKPDDLVAMRKLAATKRCVWGTECTSEKCYYNHDGEVMTLGGLM